MSINRMLTRMAVVSALNNFYKAPWPTLAGGNIFDSKIEPVEEMAGDKIFPVAVVYTDYDKDHWNKGGKIHAERLMTVTIELLVIQAEKEQVAPGEPDHYRIAYPQTDSEIETSLDVFEAQIYRALSSTHPAAEAFNYLCPSYTNAVSRRGATVEGGQRLAARQITLELKALRDPVARTVPAPIEAFLGHLEPTADYGLRVPEIRAYLTHGANATDNDLAKFAFGYTRDTASRLGAPIGAQVTLPSNVVFIGPGAP